MTHSDGVVGSGAHRLLLVVRHLHADDVLWREARAALHDAAVDHLQLPLRPADARVRRLARLHILLAGAYSGRVTGVY